MKTLIIDDEFLIRKSIGRILVKRGHEVFEAENGNEALDIWREVKPDLVLLDFMMPGRNGLEVLREIEPHLKKCVIVMSAYVGQNDHKDFIQLGASHFFSKPFDDIFKFIDEVIKIGTSKVKQQS
jgi:CheY-like chemotaxis protein